jgi:hypothetical protein
LHRQNEDEGFTIFPPDEDEKKGKVKPIFRRTRANMHRDLRSMIGNPQADTFRQLDAGTERSFGSQGSLSTDAGKGNEHLVQYSKEERIEIAKRFSAFTLASQNVRVSASSSDLATYTGYAPPVPHIKTPPVSRKRATTTTSVYSVDSELVADIGQYLGLRPQDMPQLSSEMSEAKASGLQHRLSGRNPAPGPSPILREALNPAPGQPPVSRLRVNPTNGTIVQVPHSAVPVSPYLPDDGTYDYEPSTPRSGRSRGSTGSQTLSSLFTALPAPSEVSEHTPRTAHSHDSGITVLRTPTALLAERAALGRIVQKTFGIKSRPSLNADEERLARHQSNATTASLAYSIPHSEGGTPTMILMAEGETLKRHNHDSGLVPQTPLPDFEDGGRSDAGGRLRRTRPRVPVSVRVGHDGESTEGLYTPRLVRDVSFRSREDNERTPTKPVGTNPFADPTDSGKTPARLHIPRATDPQSTNPFE